MKALLLVVLGLACLVFGAEWFVSGSARLSRRLGVPSLLVGLTIVAFGTSMPEFAVSFTASLQEANEIAVGNVIGSNIFNLLFILGLCAVIKPVPISRSAGRFDVPISLLAAVIVMAFTALAGCANWPWATIALPRWSGILLLVLFVLITGYQIRRSLREGTQEEGESAFGNHNVPLWRLIGLIAGGLAVIVIGGKLTVSGAVDLAKAVGVTERVIALTIVAIGTSLPELVTSVVAARHGENDIAVGNVVGSNIFNIFFILGVSAVTCPIPVSPGALVDGTVLAVVMCFFLIPACRGTLRRSDGVLLFLAYWVYTAWLLMTRG